MSTLKIKAFDKNVKVDIDFSEFDERVAQANKWVNSTVVSSMEPIMPKRTGKLINETQIANNEPNENGEIVVAYGGSYIYNLYSGFNENTGLPIRYSRPSAVARWGDVTLTNQENNIINGVKKILEGKK